MTQIIKKLPLPVVGLMLALATLGNILGGYHPALKTLCGGISAVLFILVTYKCIKYPNVLKEGLLNPIVGSVMCTYPMGLMVLSTYIKPYTNNIAMGLWLTAIILHILLLTLFTKRFMLNLELGKVFPSYFIVYVGFVVASVTAPAYGMQTIGKLLFWIGLANFIWLLPIVLKRLVKFEIKLPPAMPTLVILCAPASLCLAGYMSSFDQKSIIMVGVLLAVSFGFYTYVLTQMPRLLKLPFLPSYSAFTFPFVISSLAIKKSAGFIIKSTGSFGFLAVLRELSVALGTMITFYVLIRYAIAVLQVEPEATAEQA